MDFQKIVDAFYSPASIVSVEKTEDGGYGDICYMALNKKYADMLDDRISRYPETVAIDKASSFVPGTIYTDLFPNNRSFESVCYSAAVQKNEVHTYAHLNDIDIWFDIYAIPLDFEEGDRCYCIYISDLNSNADSILENNAGTANDVLKTCVKLHTSDNLEEAMENVISEIRRICNAEGCTVLLMNYDESQYSIMATDYIRGSRIKRVTQFENFFAIADTWEAMIGAEGDCAIIKDDADMEYYSRLNHP